MPFTGRYHLVRNWWLPTGELSAPFVLDRRDKALRPYLGKGEAKSEWQPQVDRRAAVRKWQRLKLRVESEPTRGRQWRLAERLLAREANCERLAALFGRLDVFPLHLLWDVGLSSTTIALSSNYVAGTGGNAIGGRFLIPKALTLNNVYYFISSYTGTPANVTTINLELRPEASAGATTPNTGSLTESKTNNPASATGWINVSGWTSALTSLSRVFPIVGDADGNGTDFTTLSARSVALESALGNTIFSRFCSTSTTGGWASGNTSSGSPANFVLVFSDGSVLGNPLTTQTAPANDTNRRGLRITTVGLVANLPIFGALWTSASANISGMEIWAGATGPSGTADNVSTDILFGTSTRIGCLTSGGTPYTLLAGTAYRVVTTNSGANANGPQRNDIGTGSDANLILAMPGAGQFYYARANGTTDWTNDLTASLPAMGLLVDGQVAAVAGGLLRNPGMSGGMMA